MGMGMAWQGIGGAPARRSSFARTSTSFAWLLACLPVMMMNEYRRMLTAAWVCR
jgi:hypothetical protein